MGIEVAADRYHGRDVYRLGPDGGEHGATQGERVDGIVSVERCDDLLGQRPASGSDGHISVAEPIWLVDEPTETGTEGGCGDDTGQHHR